MVSYKHFGVLPWGGRSIPGSATKIWFLRPADYVDFLVCFFFSFVSVGFGWVWFGSVGFGLFWFVFWFVPVLVLS